MNKFEMHVHTSDCDIYASSGGAEIVRMYYEAGYDGIVITDHYFSLFFEWFADEIKNAPHVKIMERFLRGYYAAKNEGEKLGITVLPGAEVRFDGKINDYLIYGVEEQFFYNAPILSGLKNVDELRKVLPEDALIVQAHPFRVNMTVCDAAPLDGIEGYNAGTEPFRNELAKAYARHYGKRILSGSDFHHAGSLAKGGIAVKQKIKTPKELAKVITSGEYFIIENGEIKYEN